MSVFKKKEDELIILESNSNYFVSIDKSLVLYAQRKIKKHLEENNNILDKHSEELITSRS